MLFLSLLLSSYMVGGWLVSAVNPLGGIALHTSLCHCFDFFSIFIGFDWSTRLD